MLPSQCPDHEHRRGRLIEEVAALPDLFLNAPFELFLRDKVIDERVVEKSRGKAPVSLLPGRPHHGAGQVARVSPRRISAASFPWISTSGQRGRPLYCEDMAYP